MKNLFLPRFLSLWLILCLALPNPAFALRSLNAGQEQGPVDDQLTRALAGAEEGQPITDTTVLKVGDRLIEKTSRDPYWVMAIEKDGSIRLARTLPAGPILAPKTRADIQTQFNRLPPQSLLTRFGGRRRIVQMGAATAGVGVLVPVAAETVSWILEGEKTTPAPWDLEGSRAWNTQVRNDLDALNLPGPEWGRALDEARARQLQEWVGQPAVLQENLIDNLLNRVVPRSGPPEGFRVNPQGIEIRGGTLEGTRPAWSHVMPMTDPQFRFMRTNGTLGSAEAFVVIFTPALGTRETVLRLPLSLHDGTPLTTEQFDDIELRIHVPEGDDERLPRMRARLVTAHPLRPGIANRYEAQNRPWQLILSDGQRWGSNKLGFENLIADARQTYGSVEAVEIRLETDGNPQPIELRLSGWAQITQEYFVGRRALEVARAKALMTRRGPSALVGAVLGLAASWWWTRTKSVAAGAEEMPLQAGRETMMSRAAGFLSQPNIVDTLALLGDPGTVTSLSDSFSGVEEMQVLAALGIQPLLAALGCRRRRPFWNLPH